MTILNRFYKNAQDALGNKTVLILICLILIRLISLSLYPLMDTTEGRYGEISRKMAALNDWVTPWFDIGMPFWGKPPLSFWISAFGIKVFGVNEFAVRVPHFLAASLVAFISFDWAKRCSVNAYYTLVILATTFLFLVSSGAVMTDMALCVGSTLSLRSFWLSMYGEQNRRSKEQWLFFAGLSIMLLAKGPVGWILVLFPIAIWSLISRNIQTSWQSQRWIIGGIAAILVVAPWYLIAEHRTPGFLHYFFVGEHWQRFTVSGWKGDLYGSAHSSPVGMIWLDLLYASLPWGLIAAWFATKYQKQKTSNSSENKHLSLYLLLTGLSPCFFFTLSGNILWTYILPGLPSLAMLFALYLNQIPAIKAKKILLVGIVSSSAIFIGILITLTIGGFAETKSAKSIVELYSSMPQTEKQKIPLVLFGNREYSAMFYSKGEAVNIKTAEKVDLLVKEKSIYLALRKTDLNLFSTKNTQFTLMGSAEKYKLYLGKKI